MAYIPEFYTICMRSSEKPIAIIFKNSIENKNIPNEWREREVEKWLQTTDQLVLRVYSVMC